MRGHRIKDAWTSQRTAISTAASFVYIDYGSTSSKPLKRKTCQGRARLPELVDPCGSAQHRSHGSVVRAGARLAAP